MLMRRFSTKPSLINYSNQFSSTKLYLLNHCIFIYPSDAPGSLLVAFETCWNKDLESCHSYPVVTGLYIVSVFVAVPANSENGSSRCVKGTTGMRNHETQGCRTKTVLSRPRIVAPRLGRKPRFRRKSATVREQKNREVGSNELAY